MEEMYPLIIMFHIFLLSIFFQKVIGVKNEFSKILTPVSFRKSCNQVSFLNESRAWILHLVLVPIRILNIWLKSNYFLHCDILSNRWHTYSMQMRKKITDECHQANPYIYASIMLILPRNNTYNKNSQLPFNKSQCRIF